MAAGNPDPPITVMRDADGTYVLVTVDGVATRHRGIAALWSAVDLLDAALELQDVAAA